MKNREFLGRGMKFPPQANKATGRFVMSEWQSSVKESVYIILMTQTTERFTRPEFGSKIMSYTFMDTSITRLNMLQRELQETILRQEPRISDVDIKIDTKLETGCLIINITYWIAEANTSDNMVFPFYLYAQTT